MSDSSAADRITYLLIGAGIGASLALLFAPKSGRELRDDIAEVSKRTYRKGTDGAQMVGEKVTEGVGSVREKLEKQRSNIASAIDAGKQAYREERNR
jgi:gas vesicle protein